EDHALLVPVLVEELDQALAGLAETLDGHRDILEQGVRARRARLRDGREQALSDVPQLRPDDRVRGHLGGGGQRERREQVRGRRGTRVETFRRRLLEL